MRERMAPIGREAISRPSMVMLPAWISDNRKRHATREDLPEPVRPTTERVGVGVKVGVGVGVGVEVEGWGLPNMATSFHP